MKKGSLRFPAELIYFPLGNLKTTGPDVSPPHCIVRRPRARLVPQQLLFDMLQSASCSPHTSSHTEVPYICQRPSSPTFLVTAPAASQSRQPHLPPLLRAKARMDTPQHHHSTILPALPHKHTSPSGRCPRKREMLLRPEYQRQKH